MYFTLYDLPRLLTTEQLSNKFPTPLPPLMLDRRVTEIDDTTTMSCQLHLIFMLDVYAKTCNASMTTGFLKRYRGPTGMTCQEADRGLAPYIGKQWSDGVWKQAPAYQRLTTSDMRGSTGIAAGGTHQRCLREQLPGRAHDVLRLHCQRRRGRDSLDLSYPACAPWPGLARSWITKAAGATIFAKSMYLVFFSKKGLHEE
ncbi:predicted protein [Verticillium alfalfae VaMs.102]|uniref:Predicted protein n=1 Tax=Verticillium alfalfae (strain VaMs.102 / ATCC MYA-4576 / FGSC 10136) TaxID=526221 RepID=C9SJN9_VERA1|nr:predicted protein [Verticillium alfalfae VaMs.102]EEY19653.1 predicted protein [Verticillium alfalfae VaMs.102]